MDSNSMKGERCSSQLRVGLLQYVPTCGFAQWDMTCPVDQGLLIFSERTVRWQL